MRYKIQAIRSVLVCLGTLCFLAPTAAADTCPEYVGRWPFGPVTQVATDGDLVFFTSGMVLMIADVSEPTSPEVIGEVSLPQPAMDLAVADDYVYVAAGSAGLRIIDVAIPSEPVEVGSVEVGFINSRWEAERVEVAEGHAVLIGKQDGNSPFLFVVDVAVASSPEQVGIRGLGTASGLALSEGYAFVTTGSVLRIYDLGSVTSPLEVGSVDLGGYLRDVTVSGTRAFVEGVQGFFVVDISDPSSPQRMGSTAEPRPGSWSNLVGISVAEGFAYVVNSLEYDFVSGLQVIDVRDPRHPVEWASHETPGSSAGIALLGTHAFIADGDAGLEVVDVSGAGSPDEVGILDTPGNAVHVDVAEGYAYVADMNEGLRVIDARSVSAPTEVWSMETTDPVREVAISEGHAYVANGGSGLRIFDISTPSDPVEVALSGAPNDARGVTVSGGRAYVIDGSSFSVRLLIIDVGTPAQPEELGHIDLPTYSNAVAVADGFAYVAAYRDGLRVIDVGDPSDPVEVGHLDVFGIAHSVAVEGRYAYVTTLDEGLRVVDISTPASPVHVRALHDINGLDIVVSGDTAYVAGGSLWVIDISTPLAPALLNSNFAGGNARAVATFEDHAFVAAKQDGLRVIETLGPLQPVGVATHRTPGATGEVAVGDSHAFAATRGSLRVIDVTEPSSPVEVGSIATPGLFFLDLCEEDSTVVALSGEHTFVAGHDSLYVIDVSAPSELVEITVIPSEIFCPRDLVVSGSFLFLVGDYLGLAIFDINEPSLPTEVARIHGEWSRVAVSGGFAYLTDRFSGFSVIDISTPASPEVVGFYDYGGGIGVAASRGYVYVISGSGWFTSPSVKIIDVHDPTQPVEVGNLVLRHDPKALKVAGKYLFVAAEDAVLMIDVSDPTDPTLMETYDTPGFAGGVTQSGSLLYVAEGESGFEVLDVSGCAGFVPQSPAPRQSTGRLSP